MKLAGDAAWVDFNYKKKRIFSGVTFIILLLALISFFIYMTSLTRMFYKNEPLEDYSLFLLTFIFLFILTMIFGVLYLASRFFVKVSRIRFNNAPIDAKTLEIEQIIEESMGTLNMPYHKSKREVMKGTFDELKFEMKGEGIGITVNIIRGDETIQISLSLTFEREISGTFEENLKSNLKKVLSDYLEGDVNFRVQWM